MSPKSLRLLSVFCAAVYLFTQPWQPYPGSFAIKGLSVATLAVLVFRRSGASRDIAILGAALIFSSLGDVLLDLDPQRLFVYGLGSFLIAHLIYVCLFVRNRPRPLAIGAAQAVPVILALIYSAAVSVWLWSNLGSLTIPVAIYLCAITAMVVTAILARFSNPWVICGAILFVISDSLLAIDKFKTPVPFRDVLVWSTYYLGQYGIASGLLLVSAHKTPPAASAPVSR
jgi:uncharacterized membrane protein YhhN